MHDQSKNRDGVPDPNVPGPKEKPIDIPSPKPHSPGYDENPNEQK